MEERAKPEQSCDGRGTRQWLKHSQLLMKALCRAGDDSSGQHIVLAGIDDMEGAINPALGPAAQSCTMPGSSARINLCRDPPHLLEALSISEPPSCPASWGCEVGKRNSPSLSLFLYICKKFILNVSKLI